jgi:hypothetical protein
MSFGGLEILGSGFESLPLRELARTPISSPKGPQGPCFAQFDAPSRGETRDSGQLSRGTASNSCSKACKA